LVRQLGLLDGTENIRAAFSVADRVLVMERGSVVATGTQDDLAGDERVRSAYLGAGTTSSGAALTGRNGQAPE
jgi:ABC-type lipopolysaccharide export system ATPase subunit